MNRIFTIGYQGSNVAGFLDTLKRAGVTVLVDVRAAPTSRIPGFAKRDLAPAVREAGLAYRHAVDLGNPAKRPDTLPPDPAQDFRALYRAHLDTDDAQAALAEVRALADTGTPCLMCMERDAAHCHRALIAERLLGMDPALAVEHLTVPKPPRDPRQMGFDL